MGMSKGAIAKKYLLDGRVQGVGCRAQIHSIVISNFSDLSGSVRNLGDGRVEVCLKGEVARVTEMEAILRAGLRSPVRVTAVAVENLGDDYAPKGFKILG